MSIKNQRDVDSWADRNKPMGLTRGRLLLMLMMMMTTFSMIGSCQFQFYLIPIKKSNFICWPVREFVRYYLWYLYCDNSWMV